MAGAEFDNAAGIFFVMAALVLACPGIHVFSAARKKDVDGRDIQREDALRAFARP